MSPKIEPYLAAVCQVCKHISSKLKIEDVVTVLAQEAKETFGCVGASVELIDETGRDLCVAATHGMSKSFASKGQKTPLDEETRKQVTGGVIISVPDISKDKRLKGKDALKKEGVQSLLWVPMRVGDATSGVLKLYYSDKNAFTSKDEKMAYTVAVTGAIAIQNARLYDRMECLFEVSRSLTSNLNLQQVLDLIVREAAQTMGLKGSTLRLLDEKRSNIELKAAFGFSADYLKRDKIISAEGVKEALQGSPLVIEDTSSDSRVMDPKGTRDEGIASILVVPVRVKDRSIGTLAVMSSVARKFTRNDVEFLSSLADHGAIAIENARLYEHLKRDYEDLAKDVLNWYDWGTRPPRAGS
jgi:GAF domain-containing protein